VVVDGTVVDAVVVEIGSVEGETDVEVLGGVGCVVSDTGADVLVAGSVG